jgi:hypothetical protein
MKRVTYMCDGRDCHRLTECVEPKQWLTIDGGEIGLSIYNGIDMDQRLIELNNHNPLHFCSKICFIGFFFNDENP